MFYTAVDAACREELQTRSRSILYGLRDPCRLYQADGTFLVTDAGCCPSLDCIPTCMLDDTALLPHLSASSVEVLSDTLEYVDNTIVGSTIPLNQLAPCGPQGRKTRTAE